MGSTVTTGRRPGQGFEETPPPALPEIEAQRPPQGAAPGRHPLQQATLDPDRAWGKELQASCSCGRSYPLWQKSCPSCRTKNAFPELLRKRRRLERFLDGRVERETLPRLQSSAIFAQKMRRYQGVLATFRRKPFPVRAKREPLARYLGKAIQSLQSSLQAASARAAAVETFESLRGSAGALVVSSYQECARLLAAVIGSEQTGRVEASPGALAARIEPELAQILVPYAESLKSLQLSENRVHLSLQAALAVLQRGGWQRRGIAGLWDKARSLVGQPFQILRFGTAIWRDEAERDSLHRLDRSLVVFLQQIDWFQQESERVWARLEQQWKVYRLSLNRFLVAELAESCARASPAQRRQMVRQALSLPRVGSWWWRLLFSR